MLPLILYREDLLEFINQVWIKFVASGAFYYFSWNINDRVYLLHDTKSFCCRIFSAKTSILCVCRSISVSYIASLLMGIIS